jgi:hypothetical protein
LIVLIQGVQIQTGQTTTEIETFGESWLARV